MNESATEAPVPSDGSHELDPDASVAILDQMGKPTYIEKMIL